MKVCQNLYDYSSGSTWLLKHTVAPNQALLAAKPLTRPFQSPILLKILPRQRCIVMMIVRGNSVVWFLIFITMPHLSFKVLRQTLRQTSEFTTVPPKRLSRPQCPSHCWDQRK